jgi:ppGpp synthetase/RelA/SpoT-type nucleotidyltranferase
VADEPKKAIPATPAKAVAPSKKLDPACATFLKSFNLSVETFAESGCDWEVLKRIRAAHAAHTESLVADAGTVVEFLRRVPAVHSLKMRIKDPDHLVAKIIRKRVDDPTLEVSEANYSTVITDLVGIRALHLFKDDWRPIHEAVNANWELVEPPVAYVRRGDSEELEKAFAECGCTVAKHPFGYRSLHYLVKCQPTKAVTLLVELQVRTLFEEGWSEIDHRIRYPYGENEEVLSRFLELFNRLAGSADEMGTFIKTLRQSVEEHRATLASKQSELKAMISKAKMEEQAKKELQGKLDDYLKSSRSTGPDLSTYLTPYTNMALGSLMPKSDAAWVGAIPAKKCVNCGASYQSDLLGFSLGPDLCPTCRTAGIQMKVCSRCGKTYSSNLLDFSVVVGGNLCPACRTSTLFGTR